MLESLRDSFEVNRTLFRIPYSLETLIAPRYMYTYIYIYMSLIEQPMRTEGALRMAARCYSQAETTA